MKKLILSITLSAFALSFAMADDAAKGTCPAGKDKSCCPAAAGKKDDKAGCKDGTGECCKAKKDGEKPADCCKAKQEDAKKTAPKKD